MLERILLRLLCTVLVIRDEFMRIDTNFLVHLCATTDSRSCDVIPADPVAQQHVERCRRRTLFVVALNPHALGAGTAKEKAAQLARVAVVVEMYVAISGEEVDEPVVSERVRMRLFRPEDHEIRHVHDTHTQVWNLLAQECGGSDDLESDFNTNSNENTEKQSLA